jgi:hypothetical protein
MRYHEDQGVHNKPLLFKITKKEIVEFQMAGTCHEVARHET